MTATASPPSESIEGTQFPTIWGCTPPQVHDRFWAAFGVQVVRQVFREEGLSRGGSAVQGGVGIKSAERLHPLVAETESGAAQS